MRDRLTNRTRRRMLRLWESRGGGFYGFVALLTFVYLEVVDVAGDIADLPHRDIGVGTVISFVIGNLVDALVNGLRAAIWPISWVGTFGIGLKSVLLLGGAYVTYRAVRPGVLRVLRPTDGLPAPLLDAAVGTPTSGRRAADPAGRSERL